MLKTQVCNKCTFYILHLINTLVIDTVIIDGPDSVNAVDGKTVQFSCVVQFSSAGTMEVDFFVNNTATNAPNIVESGFTESSVDILNATTRRLNITATASSQYNNTKVKCRGLNIVGLTTFPAYSEVAVLLVQGKFIITYSILYIVSNNNEHYFNSMQVRPK